jgi:hypothetical protein
LLNNSNDTFILLSSCTVRGHVIFLYAKHEKKLRCRCSDVLIPAVLIDGTLGEGTPRTGTSQPDKKPQGCSGSRYAHDGCVHLVMLFTSGSRLRAPHCIRVLLLQPSQLASVSRDIRKEQDFSPAFVVNNESEAHPAYPMDTGNSFHEGGKVAEA